MLADLTRTQKSDPKIIESERKSTYNLAEAEGIVFVCRCAWEGDDQSVTVLGK